jgi:hypothetical protein
MRLTNLPALDLTLSCCLFDVARIKFAVQDIQHATSCLDHQTFIEPASDFKIHRPSTSFSDYIFRNRHIFLLPGHLSIGR